MPPLMPAVAAAAAAVAERTAPSSQQRVRKNLHWGHIAFYYLVEEMRRWERFVFRFDKQFATIGALKSIEGPYAALCLYSKLSRRASQTARPKRRCDVLTGPV